jgi:hypothetical protein
MEYPSRKRLHKDYYRRYFEELVMFSRMNFFRSNLERRAVPHRVLPRHWKVVKKTVRGIEIEPEPSVLKPRSLYRSSQLLLAKSFISKRTKRGRYRCRFCLAFILRVQFRALFAKANAFLSDQSDHACHLRAASTQTRKLRTN